MVHADGRAGEKEGDPRHDDAGAAQAAALLQLPAVERPKNRLQEVATERLQPICLIFFLLPFSYISQFLLWGVSFPLRRLVPPDGSRCGAAPAAVLE